MQHERRLSRKDRQNTAARRAFIVLAALVVIVAGAAHFYMSARSNIRPVDENTFCPTDAKGPNSITAILVDKTDSFNPVQQAAIRDRLNEVRDQTTRYDLIEIYSVESTQKALLKPEFSMCNPGRGEDVNQWTGNPHLVEERWQSLFATPLQHLFDNATEGGSATISPIMESIQSVVVTSLDSANIVTKKIPRRLIIISDLMEYVSDYSQYKPFAGFNQFKSTPYYQSVRADLSGISVEIWYIRRKSTLAVQTDKHVNFWRDYITDQGGTIDKLWYVPGI